MSNKRVLMVEDEPFWHRFATRALEGLEIDLIIASDYGEGMTALRNGPYELLILDNKLHGIRGASIELLQAARRILHPMPPAFAHSADMTCEAQEQVRALGAEYFEKQTDQAKFRERVTSLLG